TPLSTLFPYTTLFRSSQTEIGATESQTKVYATLIHEHYFSTRSLSFDWRSERARRAGRRRHRCSHARFDAAATRRQDALLREWRSEEHTSELQSRENL